MFVDEKQQKSNSTDKINEYNIGVVDLHTFLSDSASVVFGCFAISFSSFLFRLMRSSFCFCSVFVAILKWIRGVCAC